MTWGTPIEIERRLRIKLAVCAYAYERLNISLISDHEFDALCLKVDLSVDTGHAKLDAWWRENFDPSTGQWVCRHPHQPRLEILALKIAASKGIAIV